MAPEGAKYRPITRKITTDLAKATRSWFWPKWFPSSGAVIVDGDSAVGKSRAIASWLRLADGISPLPDGYIAETVVKSIIYIAGEMDEIQLRSVFVAQGWEDAWLDKNFLAMDRMISPAGHEQPFSLDSSDHIGGLKEFIKEYKANVVIIDPFLEFYNADTNDPHNARHYMRVIQDLGMDLGVLFIPIIHWNKNEEASIRNRMSGSHQLTATARARITISLLKNNPKRRIWHLEKAIEDQQPDLAFEIIGEGTVDWGGSVIPRHSAATVVSWLAGFLGDGLPHFISDVQAAATVWGAEERQLVWARGQIGDRVVKSWEQNGAAQKETWRLI